MSEPSYAGCRWYSVVVIKRRCVEHGPESDGRAGSYSSILLLPRQPTDS